MNGTLETIDGRPALRFERHLAHPVPRVWRAVTEPRELERWFPAAAEWKPEAGEFLSEERAHEPSGELHERYAGRFGLDPTPGRRFVAGLGFRGLTLEDGPALRLERRYRHPVERLWRAISDPGELAHWFPSAAPMTVTQSEPPYLLVASWFGETLRVKLRPEGDGCVLVFIHAFADRDTAARSAAGWDRCLARLDALLAGHPMSERDSLDAWPLVHDRYAESFGVDPELGRTAFAEHPLT